MSWLLYIYITFVGFAFLASLFSFRFNYPLHLKIFSILLGITLLTEICANFLLETFNLKSNSPVYNSFLLIQYLLLAGYFRLIIESLKAKKIISLSMVVFPLFWLFTIVFIFTINHFNSYALMFGDLLIICLSARYLYELFTSDSLIDFKKSTEFWIAAALIFYSCCELPITGILNYLVTNNTSLNSILQVLNIIMYATFIYAFLCRRMTNTTKLSYLQ